MNVTEMLDEIEARAAGATPGPWEIDTETWHDGETLAVEEIQVVGVGPFTGDFEGENDLADADFIAHARQDVPALVAALRAVVRETDRLIDAPGAALWGYRQEATVRLIQAALRDAIAAALDADR